MEKTLAELEAETASAKAKAEEAGGNDDALNATLKEAEDALEAKRKEEQHIDFQKELDAFNQKPERDEREKAKFTVGKIFERFPDIKDEIAKPKTDDPVEQKLLRNQAEGVIRQKVREAIASGAIKASDEATAVQLYLRHYDRHAKTGNIYDDVDDAMWIADKSRTRNAIAEGRRVPPEPGASAGAGQRSPTNTAPQLSPEDVKRLTLGGLKQIAPGKWEGTKVIIEWNNQAKKWEQKFK